MDFKPMQLPSLHSTLLKYIYIYTHTKIWHLFFCFPFPFWWKIPWDPFLGKNVRRYNSHEGYQCYHWTARKKSVLTKHSLFFLSCFSYRKLCCWCSYWDSITPLLHHTGEPLGQQEGCPDAQLWGCEHSSSQNGDWHSCGRSGPMSAW